jgi:hypothetical protein
MKRRAPLGELRNLTHQAREQLHTWFREKDGTLPYREVARRLKEKFDVTVGMGSLSLYYNDKYSEIANPLNAGPQSRAKEGQEKTIIIRIEVPAGCDVNVVSGGSSTAGGAS